MTSLFQYIMQMVIYSNKHLKKNKRMEKFEI